MISRVSFLIHLKLAKKIPPTKSIPKITKAKAKAPFSAPNLAEAHNPPTSSKIPNKQDKRDITISAVLRHLILDIGIKIALPISIIKAGIIGKI